MAVGTRREATRGRRDDRVRRRPPRDRRARATFVPILIDQVNNFIDALPGYVEDLTSGRGRLGFLEREYQITERVREAVEEGGAAGALGISGTALAVTKSVISAVLAVVTIAFLTLFMLLEGRPGSTASTGSCPRSRSRAGAPSAMTST